MNTKAQQKILRFIKFGPVIGVILFSLTITFTLISDQYEHLQTDLDNIHTKLLNDQKDQIKQEVNRVYDYVVYQRSLAEGRLRIDLKNRVNEAYGMIESIYNNHKETDTKEQILALISEAIRPMRFNDNRGYYYIIGLDTKAIMHAFLPHLEGKLLNNWVDKKGNRVIEDVVLSIERTREQYSEYYWPKPKGDSNLTYKKIAFNKYFEPLKLYIGTGEYVDDYETVLKKEILDYVSTIKYGKNGYVFINSYEGVNLAHIKQEFRGINFHNLKDKNGIYSVRELNKIAKEKSEGFLTYIGEVKPTTGMKGEKISYVKGFDDWQWTIGSGAYTDDIHEALFTQRKLVEKSNNKQIFVIASLSLIITLIFMALSFIFSRRLEVLFVEYNDRIESAIKEKEQREEMLFQQRKMAAMGEMLENISHQWRQPLSVISTAATGLMVQNEAGLMSDKCLKTTMKGINESIQYLSKTIENFRTYFTTTKHKRVIDLHELSESSLNLLSVSIDENQIKVINDVEHVCVETYQEQLLQVFVQIFKNSVDVLKETQEPRLLLISSKTDELIEIKIIDNGGGIDEKIIDRIFEPYFTSEHKAMGKGIGLYMCQEIIVKQFNGEILARNVEFEHEDERHKGAEFTIRIPQAS